MNQKQIKLLRGQIRQAVKEVLPEVFATEVIKAMEKKLTGDMKIALDKIDERQKDLQSYFLRHNVKTDPQPTQTPKSE